MAKKRFSWWRLSPSSNFKNFSFWSRDYSGSTFATVYWISSKSGDFWLRYGDLTIFKMAAVRHLGFKKFADYVNLALVDMPFCLLIQNFAEIGQSVDKLWLKNRLSRWRPPPSWISKKLIFGYVTVIGFDIWCSVLNFIKIGRFLTEIWRFSDFQNGGRPPSWILKICIFCHVALVDMPLCFLVQNFAEISWLVMPKKAIFKMAAAAIFKLTNFNFWSRDYI